MFSPRCVEALSWYVVLTVPLGVLGWGWFWWWKTHWSRIPPDAGERRMFRWSIVWAAVIWGEVAVLVCVAVR